MYVSNPASSPRSLRLLKHKVTTLLSRSFHRCGSCLKHRVVQPALEDCARFLEEQLSGPEFRCVLEAPAAFIRNESMRKQLQAMEEPSWDYLLAHDPEEITPVHLYYKQRREEKSRRIKQQQEELLLKRMSLSPKHRPSLVQSRPRFRLKPADLFEADSKFSDLKPTAHRHKVPLPRIDSVPLLHNKPMRHRAVRSQSNNKSWLQLTEAFSHAETKHRQQVAKLAELKVNLPAISVQNADRKSPSRKA